MRNDQTQTISKKIHSIGFYPLDVLLVGATGVGKSSTLNALFGSDIAKVGTGVEPETMNVDSYQLNDVLRFWDSAGLGDGVNADKSHSKDLINILNKTYTHDDGTWGFIDLVVVILDGSQRDMGTAYHLLEDIILKNIGKKRVLIWINQADMAMKGRYWNYQTNLPELRLLEFWQEQANSIRSRLAESVGINVSLPIHYSAYYSYNLDALIDDIIKHLPNRKRKLKNK